MPKPTRMSILIDQEIAIVNAQIEILQRREDEYQRLLEDVQRLRDSVLEEKTALEIKRRDLELERHPINWLPPELLLQVFITVVEDEDDDGSPYEQTGGLYHRPPVILSHVCHKWREVALSTSRLWSRIICVFGKPDTLVPLRTFLKRASNSPLDIVCHAPADDSEFLSLSEESRRVVSLLTPHISRSRSIVFGCHGAESVKPIIDVLRSPTHEFPCLESLDLSIVSPHPSFTSTPSLIVDRLGYNLNPPTALSPLKHLRLEQVPLFNVPIHFLSNVTSLELCFPHGRALSRHQYKLRVSAFCLFLTRVPQLTTLVLCDTVPYFDVTVRSDDSDSDANDQNSTYRRRTPVELLCLQRFDWTFPFPTDVHRLLMFLSAPSLERFDLCLDNMPSRGDVRLLRGYDDSLAGSGSGSTNRVLHFDSLKELNIQCADEDAISSVLRKLLFPGLEKVEISSVGVQSQNVRKPAETARPKLLRFESIFRDPRLPHLTQLTLSHFEISSEHGRSMLGYMPGLMKLTLDTCTGVGTLIDGLKDQMAAITRLHGGGERKRPVRFCPRLEGICLLGCMDVGFAALRDLVVARNVGIAEGCDGAGELETLEGVTVAPMRKIKPLRKTRREVEPAALNSHPLSTMSLTEEAPRNINYVRIAGCPLIKEREAFSLQDLGVEVALWDNYHK